MKALIPALALICLPAQLLAEPLCGPREWIVGSILEAAGEHQIWFGVSEGLLVELWEASATGTWSVIVTRPTDRYTCLTTTGHSASGAIQSRKQEPGRGG